MGLTTRIKPGSKDFQNKTQELLNLTNTIRLQSTMRRKSTESTGRMRPLGSVGSPSGREMLDKKGMIASAPIGTDLEDYDNPAYIQSLIQIKVNELFHKGMNIVELRPEKFYMPTEENIGKLFPKLSETELKLKLKQAEKVFSGAPKGLPKKYQNLANLMLTKNKGQLRLNKERLEKFIDFIGWNDYILDIHPTDVMFNPVAKDFDVFSFTTGDVEKSGQFYLDMMDFLNDFNNDKLNGTDFDSYITLHFTTYEEFQNLDGLVYKFGSPDADGSREAQYRGHVMLKYLEQNFKGSNVRIGVETGPGLRHTRYGNYFIENEPYFFLGLLKGRKIAKLVHDFAHGEFKTLDNKQVKHILYAVERIGKYHVSGNTKDEKTLDPIDDLHEPPSPKNLTSYWDTITLAKIVSPNITFSPEFTIKNPEDIITIENYFRDLSTKLSKDDSVRYQDWADTLDKSNLSFHPDNLDDKKVKELIKYL
ncbi:MAG: hypothetical protein L6408_01250 [Nanoarchaeota archaeon]|nr:hypothetical protein [Nanoarchaeota archaeon]